MKVAVKVLPREEVLDTQGRAVEKVLNQQGLSVSTCRVGKYITLEVEAKDKTEATQKVKEIAEYVLYNPLIENYTIEVL